MVGSMVPWFRFWFWFWFQSLFYFFFFLFCNQNIAKKCCKKKKPRREKTLKKINKINMKEKRLTRQRTYINAMRMNEWRTIIPPKKEELKPKTNYINSTICIKLTTPRIIPVPTQRKTFSAENKVFAFFVSKK